MAPVVVSSLFFPLLAVIFCFGYAVLMPNGRTKWFFLAFVALMLIESCVFILAAVSDNDGPGTLSDEVWMLLWGVARFLRNCALVAFAFVLLKEMRKAQRALPPTE